MRISDWSSDVCSSDLVVVLQALERGLAEALWRRIETHGRCLQEAFGQLRHVAAALAQRRQMQAHHVEAMQQVAAETAVGHPCLEVLVGGGDHAHVDPDQLAPANAEELVLGQPPQRTETHPSELQSLMRTSYAGICPKKKTNK